jgi:hypothetical protein
MQGIARSTSHSEKKTSWSVSAESSASRLAIQPLALSYLKHHMVIASKPGGMLHGEAPEGR